MYFWIYRNEKSGSLNSMYKVVGITKQGFSKRRRRQSSYKEEVSHVKDIVLQVRKDHPTMSCRSIYYKMNPVFVGRDKFESICREVGLQAVKVKNKRRTTDSSGVIRFPNLIKSKEIKAIDEVWSSDITYFEVNNVFYYITFIIDNYSRRILGHEVSSRMLTEHTTIPAMEKAIKKRGKRKLKQGVIFHSDGGGQYYADKFLDLTKKYSFKNSMCEFAWENGKAERINGTIKNNYLKHWNIRSLHQLIKSVDRAVELYNNDKPHKSLSRMTPVEFENKIATLEVVQV